MNTIKLPKISAIIPSRNERNYIVKCLESVLQSDYPKDLIEVLVIDGISSDGTVELIDSYAHMYPFIRRIDNPKKILASAWNIGVLSADGDIVFAMNAHATIEADYFMGGVQFLLNNNCDAVGPAVITHPQHDSEFGRAISIAMCNKFGVGNSKFRIGVDTPTLVDTIHMGAYKREVFEKIGMFNEKLLRSQDIDFHKRMTKGGLRIYLNPSIKIHYYTRSKANGFVKYAFLNGYWVTKPLAVGVAIASIRHLVPAFFVLSLMIFGLGSISFDLLKFPFYMVCISYIIIALAVSIIESIKNKNILMFVYLPIVFVTYHILYGIGSIWGFLTSAIPYMHCKYNR